MYRSLHEHKLSLFGSSVGMELSCCKVSYYSTFQVTTKIFPKWAYHFTFTPAVNYCNGFTFFFINFRISLSESIKFSASILIGIALKESAGHFGKR